MPRIKTCRLISMNHTQRPIRNPHTEAVNERSDDRDKRLLWEREPATVEHRRCRGGLEIGFTGRARSSGHCRYTRRCAPCAQPRDWARPLLRSELSAACNWDARTGFRKTRKDLKRLVGVAPRPVLFGA